MSHTLLVRTIYLKKIINIIRQKMKIKKLLCARRSKYISPFIRIYIVRPYAFSFIDNKNKSESIFTIKFRTKFCCKISICPIRWIICIHKINDIRSGFRSFPVPPHPITQLNRTSIHSFFTLDYARIGDKM